MENGDHMEHYDALFAKVMRKQGYFGLAIVSILTMVLMLGFVLGVLIDQVSSVRRMTATIHDTVVENRALHVQNADNLLRIANRCDVPRPK